MNGARLVAGLVAIVASAAVAVGVFGGGETAGAGAAHHQRLARQRSPVAMLGVGQGAGPRLATVQQLCGSSMICQQRQQPVSVVQQVMPAATTTTVQTAYPLATAVTLGAPQFQAVVTNDPDAAPYGTRGDTANAYLAYMKNQKALKAQSSNDAPPQQVINTKIVSLRPPHPAATAEGVDLYTGFSPNGDEPLHFTTDSTGEFRSISPPLVPPLTTPAQIEDEMYTLTTTQIAFEAVSHRLIIDALLSRHRPCIGLPRASGALAAASVVDGPTFSGVAIGSRWVVHRQRGSARNPCRQSIPLLFVNL